MHKIDEYLTFLIRLEIEDYKTQVTVMSVIDTLLDIRNELGLDDDGAPLDKKQTSGILRYLKK